MAFAATEGERFIGPLEFYAKAFATPAADPDWNSVSGFTELFETDPESPSNLNFVEEFLKRPSAKHLAPIGEDIISQDLNLQLMAKVVNLEHLAWAAGLTNASVEDKTGDTPTRLQLALGGYRQITWLNMLIRQRHPRLSSKWVGWHIIKGNMRLNGPIPYSICQHQEIPIFVQGVCLTSGDHEGKLTYPYEEYGAAGPYIFTILPASQSVGNAVTLNGYGFGASQGDSVVTFHDAKEAVTYYHWSDTSISVLIPTGAETGNVKVTVGGVDSNNVAYTIV